MVYGNNKIKADELRTFINGLFLIFSNFVKTCSIINLGQLKTTFNILPPQTSTGKEGSSCRDAQIGRSCFLCGIIEFYG
jgi:hypothetical protein